MSHNRDSPVGRVSLCFDALSRRSGSGLGPQATPGATPDQKEARSTPGCDKGPIPCNSDPSRQRLKSPIMALSFVRGRIMSPSWVPASDSCYSGRLLLSPIKRICFRQSGTSSKGREHKYTLCVYSGEWGWWEEANQNVRKS